MSNIREVAKRAGVSTATVSRVLSRPDVVSPDTRVRVLKAVERLGYAPNSVAKHLRTLKSRKLLVTVPDIANPFFALILQGIEDAAQKNGYAVLVGDTQDDETREERYAQMLKQKEADGLIFLGHRLPRIAASVVQESSPVCAPIVNGCEFSAELGVPSVHIDNAKASAEAMQHLFELGHRAIGLEGSPQLAAMARTSSGCRVLEQNFLELNLPSSHFDGVFANAVLFHVPSQELPRVLRELHTTLKPGGVLFSSNPRGAGQEGWNGERYGAFYDWPTWYGHVSAAGFVELTHFYRPTDAPIEQQPWLASAWRKPIS